MNEMEKRIREARGLKSQTEAVLKAGIHAQAWARYKRGDPLPSAEMIIKICLALNFLADWLLGLEYKSVTTDSCASSPPAQAVAKFIIDKKTLPLQGNYNG